MFRESHHHLFHQPLEQGTHGGKVVDTIVNQAAGKEFCRYRSFQHRIEGVEADQFGPFLRHFKAAWNSFIVVSAEGIGAGGLDCFDRCDQSCTALRIRHGAAVVQQLFTGKFVKSAVESQTVAFQMYVVAGPFAFARPAMPEKNAEIGFVGTLVAAEACVPVNAKDRASTVGPGIGLQTG